MHMERSGSIAIGAGEHEAGLGDEWCMDGNGWAAQLLLVHWAVSG